MPEGKSIGTITHLMRAPVIGGSELETLTIVRCLNRFNHRLVFPQRFEKWTPSIARRFPDGCEIVPSPDVETEMETNPPELLHIQFPFIIKSRPEGLDSVLELRALPEMPVLFTVHAAVNVPVLPDIHYIFHTESQARLFSDEISEERVTICPSLVEIPDQPPDRLRKADEPFRILWVCRSEEGKFHPQIPAICRAVLDACPEVTFHFVGEPPHFRLPSDERLTTEPFPAADLDCLYRSADLFWYFPDPRLHETWCRTVTEAMGFGLACVVAGHGAMHVQARHGMEGIVVESPDECVSALKEFSRNDEKRFFMGNAGRQRAQSFFHESRSTLDALYRRLLNKEP